MTVTSRVRQSATASPLVPRGLSARMVRGDRVACDGDAERKTGGFRQTAYFVRHYFEMCAPMCIGFAVGDLVYFWAAGRLGYSDPFLELPELSLLVVTFTMTAPMTGWMLFRGMPFRPTAEMSAVMPILAVALLSLGWLTILSRSDLALLEHGLMMPAMLVPMFFRFDLYTGRTGHAAHGANARSSHSGQ